MRLIPLLLDFNDSPTRLTVAHQVAAGRLAWDVKLLYDRETRRSMQFAETVDGQPNLAATVIKMNQNLPQDAQGDYLWERHGKVNQTDDDWYNISQYLEDTTTFSWENDLIIAWINGNPGDHTGIGGPYRADAWNATRDASKGGVALNGIGQVTSYLGANFGTSWARRMVLYAAHETGHALGERHSGFDENGVESPNAPGYYMNVMGYGYNFLSAGLEDKRTGNYFEEGGLFTKTQRARIEQHSVFVDRPDEATPVDPGKYDGKELRIDSLAALLTVIDNETIGKEEVIARLNIGPMQSERT